MIVATSIELFKNLMDLEYEYQKLDLHNDFDFEKIIFENETLLLFFKNIKGSRSIMLTFLKVSLTSFDFFNVSSVNYLTIDNLYRGRALVGKELIDQSLDGRGYFFIEFYEGQMIEFWTEGLAVELV